MNLSDVLYIVLTWGMLACCLGSTILFYYHITGDPLHSRALAHSRAPLFTQPCPHCSHSRAPGEQWARLCVFTLQGCVQAAWLCRGSPMHMALFFLCIAGDHFPCLLSQKKLSGNNWHIMMLWHGNIFCITYPFWCESTSQWSNSQIAGDLKHLDTHGI